MSTLDVEKVMREVATERIIRDLKIAQEEALLSGKNEVHFLTPNHGELIPVSSDADYNYVQFYPPYHIRQMPWWDDMVKATLTTKEKTMTRKDTVETITIDVHATARVYVRIPDFSGESGNTKRNMRENYIEDELIRLRSDVFEKVQDLNNSYTVSAVSVDSELVDEDVFARIDSCE